jgi:hypothetical protein
MSEQANERPNPEPQAPLPGDPRRPWRRAAGPARRTPETNAGADAGRPRRLARAINNQSRLGGFATEPYESLPAWSGALDPH